MWRPLWSGGGHGSGPVGDQKDHFFLLGIVMDSNIDQLIDFQTHTKGNILDLLLTNRESGIPEQSFKNIICLDIVISKT